MDEVDRTNNQNYRVWAFPLYRGGVAQLNLPIDMQPEDVDMLKEFLDILRMAIEGPRNEALNGD